VFEVPSKKRMSFELTVVVIVAVAAAALFITGRLPPDLVALLVMVSLLCTGVVTVSEGLAGFSNPATVTVGAMLVLSAGVERSGALRFAAGLLARMATRSMTSLQPLLMAFVGTLSAFVSNTAVVAVLMPVILRFCERSGRSPSRLLMLLSFASMFGGVCTLIGTSTNIVASSIVDAHGLEPFGMFEFTQLGLVFFGVGILYMSLVGARLVPERRGPDGLARLYGMGDYLTEIVLAEGALSVGKRLRVSPLATEAAIEIIGVRRASQDHSPPDLDLVLEAGDVLTVRGSVEKLAKAVEREGVSLRLESHGAAELIAHDSCLVEAVVGPSSRLVGRSIRAVQLRELYGTVVLALRHHERLDYETFADTPLHSGDVLLLRLKRPALELLSRSRLFLLLSEVPFPVVHPRKIALVTVVLLAVVLSAALGLVPIVVSAVTGAVALVLLRCLEIQDAYDAIDWRVLALLAGMLALGAAMERSGAAGLVAQAIIDLVGNHGIRPLIAVLYLATAVLTELMSNNATVALLTPIAIAAGERFGIDPRPMVLTVMFAASTSFMTPIGYQTNTMIFGPGHFRFFDFARVGGFLNVLFWILATLLIPWFFP
jgi:di/tricarboxylate transporter